MVHLRSALQPRPLSGIAVFIILSLAGCATLEPLLPIHTGTVTGVYAETAPGLYIAANLLDHRSQKSRWVRVDLHHTSDHVERVATARLRPDLSVEPGDIVRVHIAAGHSHELSGGVIANRVLDVVTPNVDTVATLSATN